MTREQKQWIDSHPEYRIVGERAGWHVFVSTGTIDKAGNFTAFPWRSGPPAAALAQGAIPVGKLKDAAPPNMRV